MTSRRSRACGACTDPAERKPRRTHWTFYAEHSTSVFLKTTAVSFRFAIVTVVVVVIIIIRAGADWRRRKYENVIHRDRETGRIAFILIRFRVRLINAATAPYGWTVAADYTLKPPPGRQCSISRFLYAKRSLRTFVCPRNVMISNILYRKSDYETRGRFGDDFEGRNTSSSPPPPPRVPSTRTAYITVHALVSCVCKFRLRD